MITMKLLLSLGLFVLIIVPGILLALAAMFVVIGLESGLEGVRGKEILKFLAWVSVIGIWFTMGLDIFYSNEEWIIEFFAR